MKVSAVSVLVFGAATLATPTFGMEKEIIDWATDQLGGNGKSSASQGPAAPGPASQGPAAPGPVSQGPATPGTATSEDCSSTTPVVTTTPKPAISAPPATSAAPPVTSAAPPTPDCNVKPGAKVPVGCPDPCRNVKPGSPAPEGCPASSAPVATTSLIVMPSPTPSKPLIVDDKPTPAPNSTYKPTTPPVLAGASIIAQGLGVGVAVAALIGFAFAL
ncbi:hypothetical protein RB595_002020 [Gaeumannomyces hyphopodioides]